MTSVQTCHSCGALLVHGAAVCEKCGATVSGSERAPTSERILTPEAERTLRKAADHANNFVITLGPEKLIALTGGIFGIVGAVLPFYTVQPLVFIGAVDITHIVQPNTSLTHAGAFGAIVILVAVALGVAPLVTMPVRSVTLAGFGLGSVVMGMLIGEFFRSAMFGRTFAAGFYFAVLGFAMLCYVYARRAFTENPIQDSRKPSSPGGLGLAFLVSVLAVFLASLSPYVGPRPDVVGQWSGTPSPMPDGISQTAGKFARLAITEIDTSGRLSGTLKIDALSGPIVGQLRGRHISLTIALPGTADANYYGMNLEGTIQGDSIAGTLIETGASQWNTAPLKYEVVLTRDNSAS